MIDPQRRERPVAGAGTGMGWGSDVAAEMLRRLGIEYIALNPGASFRGLHDSLVNYLVPARKPLFLRKRLANFSANRIVFASNRWQ